MRGLQSPMAERGQPEHSSEIRGPISEVRDQSSEVRAPRVALGKIEFDVGDVSITACLMSPASATLLPAHIPRTPDLGPWTSDLF